MRRCLGLILALTLLASLMIGAAAEERVADEEIAAWTVEPAVPEAQDAPLPADGVEAEAARTGIAGVAAAPEPDGIAVDRAHFPDGNFRKYVRKNIDADGDGRLSDAERDAVVRIDVYTGKIASLKGIELFPKLERVICTGNQLTELDVSGNPALVLLHCQINALKRLDVGDCAALVGLDCASNRLKRLDIRKNVALERLDCAGNRIAKIDLYRCKRLLSAVKRSTPEKSGKTVSFSYAPCEDVGYGLRIDASTSVRAKGKTLFAGKNAKAKDKE